MDNLLRIFIAVVEKENFTRAADYLHMTQPAVSQYIQALEQSIGTKLLIRNNKRVQLNTAGEIVYHHAREILGQYTQMQKLVDDLMNKASGNLSVGASYTFGEYILPHIAAYMRQKYPLIKLKITIANTKRIADWVAGRQLEIGVIDGDTHHKNLEKAPFADDLMYIIAAAGRPAPAGAFPIEALKKETWILREATSGTRKAAEKMFSQLHFQPQNFMEFGSTQIIKESVCADLGVSLLSHCTFRNEISLGLLKILDVIGTPFQRPFYLITPTSKFKTKAVDIFTHILRNKSWCE